MMLLNSNTDFFVMLAILIGSLLMFAILYNIEVYRIVNKAFDEIGKKGKALKTFLFITLIDNISNSFNNEHNDNEKDDNGDSDSNNDDTIFF
jgi:hypothetical protein